MTIKNSAFRHFEGNSAAHLKSSCVGAGQTLIVKNGKLLLGRWQAVYFTEFEGHPASLHSRRRGFDGHPASLHSRRRRFDAPRDRNYYLKVIEG